MFKLYNTNSFYVGTVLRRGSYFDHDRGIIGYFADGDALINYYDRALLLKIGDEYVNISEVSSERELNKVIRNKNGKYNSKKMKVLSGLERYNIDNHEQCVDGKVTNLGNFTLVDHSTYPFHFTNFDNKKRISFQKAKRISRKIEKRLYWGMPFQN